jgi:hypothetical protein
MKEFVVQLRNPRDFWSGAMFTAAGCGFALGALHYSFGSSARPGPAYFPFGLGILMALLGLIILAKSQLTRPTAEGRALPVAWRPLGIVVLAILVFAVTLPRLGIALALPLLVTVISLAGDRFRWRDVALTSVVLTVGSWAVFVYGLGLVLPVWPAFLR